MNSQRERDNGFKMRFYSKFQNFRFLPVGTGNDWRLYYGEICVPGRFLSPAALYRPRAEGYWKKPGGLRPIY